LAIANVVQQATAGQPRRHRDREPVTCLTINSG
jgi:hypothetical protein